MATLQNFFTANFDGIIISLIVGFIFFVLGPIGLWFSGRRVRKERIFQAKEMLIDLIEGMIVNQEKITSIKLQKILNAVEREVKVTFDTDYDLEKLFEDIHLRFQRSRHLDADQKNNYSDKLLDLSKELNSSEEFIRRPNTRRLTRGNTAIFEDIESYIKDNTPAKTALVELKEKIYAPLEIPSPFMIYRHMREKYPLSFYTITSIVVVFYISLIFFYDELESFLTN